MKGVCVSASVVKGWVGNGCKNQGECGEVGESGESWKASIQNGRFVSGSGVSSPKPRNLTIGTSIQLCHRYDQVPLNEFLYQLVCHGDTHLDL